MSHAARISAQCLTPILYVRDFAEAMNYHTEKLLFDRLGEWGGPPAFGAVRLGKVEIFFCLGAQEVAKRLDCVHLSAAFTWLGTCRVASKSADKSDALQTLRAVRNASPLARTGINTARQIAERGARGCATEDSRLILDPPKCQAGIDTRLQDVRAASGVVEPATQIALRPPRFRRSNKHPGWR